MFRLTFKTKERLGLGRPVKSGKTLLMPKIRRGERPPSDNSDKAMGKRLRQLRLAFGKTQKEMGKVVGVSHNMISACEAGRENLGSDRLIKLLIEFDAPLEWLYLGWKRHLSPELRHKLDRIDQEDEPSGS